MDRRITAAALIALAGCGGGGVLRVFEGRPEGLNYAQYRSLEEGMAAAAIQRAFGRPVDVLESEGTVRGLTYRCEDADGRPAELRMVFDDQGNLAKWALRDPGAPEAEEGGG